MSETVIADLIERVAAATGADRELDALLWWHYIVPTEDVQKVMRRVNNEGIIAAVDEFYLYGWRNCRDCVPFCSASIDAALALVERVLPGAAYVINAFDVQRKPTVVRTARVHLSAYEGAGSGSLGAGPTPPLAILLALLTALQSQTPGPTGASNEGTR